MQELTLNSYGFQPVIKAVRQFHRLDTHVFQTQEFAYEAILMKTKRVNAVLFFTLKKVNDKQSVG
jgi:hypothetical protein